MTDARLTVVVGAGGVGKTTLAAAMAVGAARAGRRTLVMTFDPSLRLKDALGVGDEAKQREVRVKLSGKGELRASLLDARDTFDRLVARYAPDGDARERILRNRFYDNLSGTLSGILEYMAVERLFEVASEGRFDEVILDTPPTRQALDFLGAPARLVGFLDSGALRLALKPWFDARGRLRATARVPFLGRGLETFLDRVVGIDVLRDMAEFFQAFAPLYEGFRARAVEVERLLRAEQTRFVLVSGPGEEKIPDTLFFARRLDEAGYRLHSLMVNRVHPLLPAGAADDGEGVRLLAWLGARDAAGLTALRRLLGSEHPLVEVPLLAEEPTDVAALESLAATIDELESRG